MGLLSKIISDVGTAVVDVIELSTDVAVDVVTSPIDLIDEDGELFERSKDKLEEMGKDA